MLDPFWLMVAVNREQITILGLGVKANGFHTRELALAEAVKRAKDHAEERGVTLEDDVTVFDMSVDAQTFGKDVRAWLQRNGTSLEDANKGVRALARGIGRMMKGRKPRR